ncbi:nudix hydrolase family protein [gamma proteobacterium HTCC5015]|nr:nudix hydrolase family protein [gamma proteobacterium HTCC5015]
MVTPDNWHPHVTVAALVERDGQFLLVEEWSRGRRVFNQPAGHVEPCETLIEACRRETLEETGWRVEPTAVLAVQRWHRPYSQHTYFRTVLIAEALEEKANAELDSDIIQAHWMSYDDIIRARASLRSPLVESTVATYLDGQCYPLSLLQDWG